MIEKNYIHRIGLTQSGFTLLELMIAMTISSLIAVIGAASLSTVSDFYSKSTAAHNAREDAKSAEKIIRHEWSGRGVSLDLTSDRIVFNTTSPLSAPSRNTAASVEYRCVKDDSGSIQLIQRSGKIASNFDFGEGANSAVQNILASKLRLCSFSTMGTSTDDKGRRIYLWMNSWSKNRPAPALLRLEIRGVFGEIPPIVFTAKMTNEQN